MSERPHDDILELLALYALDGLEPAERGRVSAHLAGCPSCEAEAARMRALVSTVSVSVPPQAPNAALRSQILQRATGGAPAQPRPRPPVAQRPAPAAARRAVPSLWLARATTALALVLIVWNVFLSLQIRDLGRQVQTSQDALAIIAAPGTTAIALAAQPDFAGAQGKAYVDSATGRVVLVVQNLQPVGTERTYQMWIITDAGAASAGLFSVDPSGTAIAWLDLPYASGGAIGVSLEPAGGSPQPTQVVLVGS